MVATPVPLQHMQDWASLVFTLVFILFVALSACRGKVRNKSSLLIQMPSLFMTHLSYTEMDRICFSSHLHPWGCYPGILMSFSCFFISHLFSFCPPCFEIVDFLKMLYSMQDK